ncbi:hypothetical protein ACOMHN_002743 [Nucella lapillus]
MLECDNDICLSPELACNGFNDCGDDSDEVEGCSLAAGIIVAIVFGVISFFIAFCVFLVCVRRRRRTYLRLAEESQEMMLEHLNSLATRCEVLEVEQEFLNKTIHTLQKQTDHHDNLMRRHNLLFFGVPRTVTETPEQCEAKVHEVIRTTMNCTEQVLIERVHRLGSAVMVKFLTVKDKRLVLAHARNLRGKHVRISDDFPPKVREIRKGLTELKNTYVSEGKTAKMRYDKLYTEFDVFTYDLETKTVKKVHQRERVSSGHGQYLALTSHQTRNRIHRDRRHQSSSESDD